jgi:hypothetical protein
MKHNFIKDPDAVLDYQVDWSSWLNGDTISTSSWTVPQGLSKESDSKSTTATTVWLSGGVAGQSYSVVNHIVTAAGREEDRTIKIMCLER